MPTETFRKGSVLAFSSLLVISPKSGVSGFVDAHVTSILLFSHGVSLNLHVVFPVGTCASVSKSLLSLRTPVISTGPTLMVSF